MLFKYKEKEELQNFSQIKIGQKGDWKDKRKIGKRQNERTKTNR